MNIVMVISVPLPPSEGMGHYTWNLARFLVRQGHCVQIITRGGGRRTTREEVDGITIWRPPFLPVYPFHVHLHSWFVNRLIRRLEQDVDVFHLHTPLPPLIRTERPVVLTVHTPMLTDSRSMALRDAASLLVKLQVPVSLQIERALFRQAQRITAVSTSVAQELGEYGVAPSRVSVLWNGADTACFTPPTNGSQRERIVFAAGRLGLRKGFEDLLACVPAVVARCPDVQFCIAGSGPMELALRTQIAALRIGQNVKLLGHIQGQEAMAEWYRRARVFVHPAHYEGLPTVLLEAMACGCPAVATAVCGALDVVRPGENGLLVPPHSPECLANALLQLLGDEVLSQQLGAAARRTIELRYAWNKVGADYARLYQEVVEKAKMA